MYVIGGEARKKETTQMTKTLWVDDVKINVREGGWGGKY
jgi:hypothetical protein